MSKPRVPRLRASCDGCFIAKVKCSKDRPICARCLTCGTECNYSPSSRSGKPKSDGQPHTRPQPTMPLTVNMYPGADEHMEAFNYAPQQFQNSATPGYAPEPDFTMEPGLHFKTEPGFKTETQWDSPPNINDGNMSRTQSMGPAMVLHGGGSYGMGGPSSASTPMEWSTNVDPSGINPNAALGLYYDPSADISGLISPGHSPNHSCDMSMAMSTDAAWSGNSDQSTIQNMASYSQGNPTPVATPLPYGTDSPSHYSPGMASNPCCFPTASTQKPSIVMPKRRTQCNCFAKCLKSLDALHYTWSRDRQTMAEALHLNRASLEVCVQVIACNQCMSLYMKHTAMLLAIIIGQITALYQYIFHSVLGSAQGDALPEFLRGSDVMASIGERHFQVKTSGLELVGMEIQKLIDVYSRFADTCGRIDDHDACWAMITRLNNTVSSALELVNRSRKDARNISYH